MMRLSRNPVRRHARLLFAGDLSTVIASAWISAMVRLDVFSATPYILKHFASFTFQGLIYIICFTVADLYDVKRDFRRIDQVLKILAACLAGMALSIIIFYSRLTYIGRGVFVIYGTTVFMLAVLMRSALVSTGNVEKLKRKVIIVGAGKAGRNMLEVIGSHNCWLSVVGFIDDDPAKQGTLVGGKPVLGTSAGLIGAVLENEIDTVIVAITHHKSVALLKTLIRCHYYQVQVTDMPTVFETITGKLPLRHINDEWLLQSAILNRFYIYKNIKRMGDIVISLTLLVLSAPVLAVAALLIKMDSRGQVLFRQERLGLDYKKFILYKLRTMVEDAEAATGATWAKKDDPRVTRVGRVLRKLRIDEIPQLYNVLKGDMSFVGPRPEREVFIRRLEKEIPFYGHRLVVKPGITGWAQIMYPYAGTVEQSMEKLRYDLYYIKNLSFILDIIIVLKTIKVVLSFGGR